MSSKSKGPAKGEKAATGVVGEGQLLKEQDATAAGAPLPPQASFFPSPSQHFTIWTDQPEVPAVVPFRKESLKVRINAKATTWRGAVGTVAISAAMLNRSNPHAPVLQESVLVTLEGGFTTYQKVMHLDRV